MSGNTVQSGSLPTISEWEEYRKRRKELSLSAERYRVEIRALKKRIRQLETFLLYLPGGGADEKNPIDYSSIDSNNITS